MKQVTGNNLNTTHFRTSIQLNLDGFSVIYPGQSTISNLSYQLLNSLQLQPNSSLQTIWNTPNATLVPSHLFSPTLAHNYLITAGLNPVDATPLYTNLGEITLIWCANNAHLATIDAIAPSSIHLHPLQLLLQNKPTTDDTTIALLDNNIIHIVTFAGAKLINALSAPVSSPVDALYYISQLTVSPNSQVELHGDINNDLKTLIAKRFKRAKFYTQQSYALTNLHT